ncbi:MAG: GGDEF domain-containing protein [Candidatus Acidiferrales bacterium]
MTPSIAPITPEDPDYGVAEIQSNRRKLERRGLWVWGNAALIILALTALVVALSASLHLRIPKPSYGWDLNSNVWGLVGLVLIFTLHMIYQQVRLQKVQGEMAEQQIEAEVFRRLALFDPLTGLYNRRFAEQRLKAEIARSERQGLTMIIALLDLNDFKKINDGYGHQAGDLVLKEFAKCLISSTRGSDLAVRWGGDEFMLLLLDCKMEQLSVVLTRLRGLTVELSGKTLPVSFSIGCKAYEAGYGIEEMIEEADRNLYSHKTASKAPKQPLTVPA